MSKLCRKHLVTNWKSVIFFKKKNKKKNKSKKEEITTSSSKEDDAAVVVPWERHTDSLRHEEQRKEVMAIRSGPARILSAGSTRCCSTSSGTETQNAYISSSETPRRKNAPTAVSTYQLVRHLNQTTRRNGTKKQGIRGARKCRSKRNLGILQALNDDTTNAPTFFLKRRGVSTKTSGRFKKTSGFPKIGF